MISDNLSTRLMFSRFWYYMYIVLWAVASDLGKSTHCLCNSFVMLYVTITFHYYDIAFYVCRTFIDIQKEIFPFVALYDNPSFGKQVSDLRWKTGPLPWHVNNWRQVVKNITNQTIYKQPKSPYITQNQISAIDAVISACLCRQTV